MREGLLFLATSSAPLFKVPILDSAIDYQTVELGMVDEALLCKMREVPAGHEVVAFITLKGELENLTMVGFCLQVTDS